MNSRCRCIRNGIALLAPLLETAAAFAHPNHPPFPILEVTTDLTWSEDIRPIYREHCMRCHSPVGTVAPYFDLSTYGGTENTSGAADWAYGAAEEVLNRRMPPFGADPRYNAFANDGRLKQDQIDKIVEWAHGGRPEGPEKDLPTPQEFLEQNWTLGEPDLVLDMDTPESLFGEDSDAIFTRTFPVEFDGAAKWITAIEFLPGMPDIVQEMVVFSRDSEAVPAYTLQMQRYKEYDPMADEGVTETYEREIPPGTHFLGQWVRGDVPVVLPAGVGKLLRSGSSIELVVRYDPFAAGAPAELARERSRIGIHFADEKVKRVGEVLAVSDDEFVLPAGRADCEVKAQSILKQDTYLYGVYPHLGPTATDVEVLAHYPDGRSTTLLYVPAFDDALNQSYLFGRPLFAPAGTRVEAIGHYDNSEQNWDNPYDPPQNLAAPKDERLYIYVDYYTPGWIYEPEAPGEAEAGDEASNR